LQGLARLGPRRYTGWVLVRDWRVKVDGSMIELSCMYCGRSVRTEETGTYRQIPCPGCGHCIPVRIRRPGDVPSAAPGDSAVTADGAGKWVGKSNEDIARQLLSGKVSKEEQDRQMARTVLSPFLPQYDDLTLFALSLAFVLLALIAPELRRDLTMAFCFEPGTRVPALVLAAGFGMVCSLVNVFLRREKSQIEKWAMLAFAVLATGGTGLYAGWLMFQQSRGWLIIFPAWNIINGALLLLLARVRIIDTDCIIDKPATFGQILVTAVAMPILLTSCLYLFDLHWAITFSIAVAYTMSLHHALGDVFGRHAPPEREPASLAVTEMMTGLGSAGNVDDGASSATGSRSISS